MHVRLPLKHIAGLSQQCYSQPNCVAGTEIVVGSSTPNDCCVGTNLVKDNPVQIVVVLVLLDSVSVNDNTKNT